MLYSVLEQHIDGRWWYHPWVGTYNTREEAEASYHRCFDDGRPYIIYEHNAPLYQEYSTSTLDFVHFGLNGLIVWTKDEK